MKSAVYIILLICSGCTVGELKQAKRDVVSSAQGVGYSTAYVGTESAYSSSLSVGVVPTFAAKSVNKNQLMGLVSEYYDYKFYSPWYYMGTKDLYHYFVIYPFLDTRKFYRILENEFHIDNPFKLTSRQKKWRKSDIDKGLIQSWHNIVLYNEGIELYNIQPYYLDVDGWRLNLNTNDYLNPSPYNLFNLYPTNILLNQGMDLTR